MLHLTWGFGLILALSLAGRLRLALAAAAVLAAASAATPQAIAAPIPWFCQVALLCSAPLVIERSSSWTGRQAQWRRRLADQRAALDGLTIEWQALVDQNRQREAQADALQQFYTITKAASPALHPGELLATTAATFGRFCSFRLMRLLQVDAADDGHWRITAVHESGENRAAASPVACRVSDGRILRRHLTRPQATMVTAEEAAAWGVRTPEGSVGWVPLLVESRLAGLLVIEGLDPAAFDRFLIVAHQAALQLARVQLYQRLEMLSVTDGLTGLFVRRHFLHRVQEELVRAHRLRWPAALLMLDLDHFKEQNDRYGHLVGDAVLREIAQRLRAHVRQIDIVGRLGGEEFGIFLVDAGVDEVRQAAERIRSGIAAAPIQAYDEEVTQTISIGVALFPQDGGEIAALIERADAALYQAKARGRNCLVFHDA